MLDINHAVSTFKKNNLYIHLLYSRTILKFDQFCAILFCVQWRSLHEQTPKPMMSHARKNARVTMHHTHRIILLWYYALRSTSEENPIVSLWNSLFCVTDWTAQLAPQSVKKRFRCTTQHNIIMIILSFAV